MGFSPFFQTIIINILTETKKSIHLKCRLLFNYLVSLNYLEMSYLKVYIHFVWSTKNRIPFLTTHDLRQKVWGHIKENASKKGIIIDRINGYQEHCHCLISLGKDQSPSSVMQ